MSYESPISIYAKDVSTQLEDEVLKVIQSYSIFINREELIRALKYDRDQYDKGFEDGKNYRYCEGVKPYFKGNRWHCGECSVAIGRYWKFCQYCGQKIGWDEVENEDA